MANFADVNKAIKKAFPGKKIVAVRGPGYVYFEGDDGFDKIKAIYSNPQTTSTEDMIRMVLEDISSYLEEQESEMEKMEDTPVAQDKRATVKAVNKKLKELGAKEILVSGKSGFYFTGGKSKEWKENGVYLSRIGDISVDEWVEVYYHLSRPVAVEKVLEIEPAPVKKHVVREIRKIAPGTTVKLKRGIRVKVPEGREDNRQARILTMLPSLGEGAVFMDRDLRGCRYWNLDDLEVIG